uniref:One cut domain family member n=1 Tax=Fundulus heteroclitus TaxID=8078 RepID=A0A146UJU3_FUNHE
MNQQHSYNTDETLSEHSSDPPFEELNTRELAQMISLELKRYSIPQAVFAQQVLSRSQGTLSDLLRNPKPWSKLKSGRETFKRMWRWLQQPELTRMGHLCSVANKRKDKRQDSITKLTLQEYESSSVNQHRRPRLVFTDIQRRTLQAIFKETKRPSREMQVTIAQQLGLEVSTVSNFFMNARRRSTDKWQDGNTTTSVTGAANKTPSNSLLEAIYYLNEQKPNMAQNHSVSSNSNTPRSLSANEDDYVQQSPTMSPSQVPTSSADINNAFDNDIFNEFTYYSGNEVTAGAADTPDAYFDPFDSSANFLADANTDADNDELDHQEYEISGQMEDAVKPIDIILKYAQQFIK